MVKIIADLEEEAALRIGRERLGHGSIQITLDTYSHVAPGLQQAAANKFDDIALPKQKTTAKSD